MDRQPPLVLNLPSMSDDSVVEIHRCLGALIDAFESSYELQLWRYDEQLPEHIRPDKFKGEPF